MSVKLGIMPFGRLSNQLRLFSSIDRATRTYELTQGMTEYIHTCGRHFLIHTGFTHDVRVDQPTCHQNSGKEAFFLLQQSRCHLNLSSSFNWSFSFHHISQSYIVLHLTNNATDTQSFLFWTSTCTKNPFTEVQLKTHRRGG